MRSSSYGREEGRAESGGHRATQKDRDGLCPPGVRHIREGRQVATRPACHATLNMAAVEALKSAEALSPRVLNSCLSKLSSPHPEPGQGCRLSCGCSRTAGGAAPGIPFSGQPGSKSPGSTTPWLGVTWKSRSRSACASPSPTDTVASTRGLAVGGRFWM